MTETENIAPAVLFSPITIRKQGIKLYIDGKAATLEEIALRCVNEGKSLYMPDSVLDDAGRLTEIRYDKVVYE
jgi:hypothetical protein